MDEPHITIKITQGIAVDYVDMSGQFHTRTLHTDSESEAVKTLRKAWNSNLLWYFKLHLQEAEPLCKSRSIPFPESTLKHALSYINLQKQIARTRGSFELYEKTVLDGLSSSATDRLPREADRLSAMFSEWKALEAVSGRLSESLERAGVNIAGLLLAGRANAIANVIAASKSLKQVETGKVDSMFLLDRMIRVEVKAFIDSLPEVPGIFTKSHEPGLIPALEGEA